MDGWGYEARGAAARGSGKTVAQAQAVPTDTECPGRFGLCGLPLGDGESLCRSCADTLVFDPRGSASLQRQIQPPEIPECTACRRPVPHAGETCSRCLGRAAAGISPSLWAAIETRTVPECPGDGGMCGAPLAPGESRCARCRHEQQYHHRTPAPAATWQPCKGRDGRCGRLVLSGRGQCLECRQAAGISRIPMFGADGTPTT
jgi:hypothetical protein